MIFITLLLDKTDDFLLGLKAAKDLNFNALEWSRGSKFHNLVAYSLSYI